MSELAAGGAEAGAALARACLALEPLALSNGKLLARLDRLLASAPRPDANGDHSCLFVVLGKIRYILELIVLNGAYSSYSVVKNR